MSLLNKIATVALASMLVSACGASDGYYDTNGNWISTQVSHQPHSPMPGGYDVVTGHPNNYDADANYTRRGYYDYNGYYIPYRSGPAVPRDMMPPAGMCRVWFLDRDASDEPAVESCAGIRGRVPAGAYVIYGG